MTNLQQIIKERDERMMNKKYTSFDMVLVLIISVYLTAISLSIIYAFNRHTPPMPEPTNIEIRCIDWEVHL